MSSLRYPLSLWTRPILVATFATIVTGTALAAMPNLLAPGAPQPAPSFAFDPGARVALPARPSLAPRFSAGPLRGNEVQLVGTSPGFAFESAVANRKLGMYAVPAGDLNGDGISDFVALGDVNSFNTALYVFLGSPTGPVLAPGFPILSLPPGAQVAPAGDVNGDGRADLFFFWYGSGSARVYFGSATGVDTVGYNALNAHFGINAFGMNAAPAGDVNGDGYDDVIVGMPQNGGFYPCSPSLGSGVVEVLYGSSTGLSATHNWYVEGCYASGNFAALGTSVAGAGDVNGDGYDDIVIGAPGADQNLVGITGKVYVLYGSASGLPLLNGFSNLGAVTQGTTINGHQVSGTFGQAVAQAGDLNADGYADIAVGAPYDDQYGTDSGQAWVFKGTAAGIDSAYADVLWNESAGVPNAHFGNTIFPAGDVNGDGRPDLLVAEASRVDLAESYGGTLLIDQLLPFAPSSSVVITAGDVNGDGISDILVGEQGFTNTQSFEGHVEVFYGSPRLPAGFASWSITQTVESNPNMGWSVASAGDVNGDGFDDVLIGEPTWYDFTTGGSVNNGLVLLYYGHATGLSPAYDWFAYGANNDQLGISVSSADVNGDGYSDIIVGAHTSAGGFGSVRIWYGGPGGPSNSGPNVTLTGFSSGSQFGASVAGAGDVNGDGYPDIVVGAPYGVDPSSPQTAEGRAYVYLGGPGGLSSSPVWSRSGGQANAHFGTSVATAGDMNGDGFADVVIGAPDYDTVNRLGQTVTDAGAIYVAFGSPAGPSSVQASSVLSPWRYGAAVSSAGDVNGDGYSDLVVGAPNATGSFANEGAVRVILGSPGGISSILWTQYGGEAYGGFGSSVACAGDVNGDGLSDVLVGAVFQDMGGPTDQGRAYIYLGPLPTGASPAWTGSGGSTYANMGHSLANAGDVNGDGWPDYVFGEPGYTDTFYRQGFVQVRYGCGGGGVYQIGRAYHLTAPGHLVQPGDLSDPGSLGLISSVRSAAGRTHVRLQYSVSPPPGLHVPAATGFSNWLLTNGPGAYGSVGAVISGASGLVGGVPYAWAVRSLARNVWYPSGPWRSPERNGRTEADARVPGTFLAVDRPAPAVLMLASVRPDPMFGQATVAFTLTQPGPVSLEILDVQGRHVRALHHGMLAAGPYERTWDGRADDGHATAAGVYLVRLEAEGHVLSRKVVRLD